MSDSAGPARLRVQAEAMAHPFLELEPPPPLPPVPTRSSPALSTSTRHRIHQHGMSNRLDVTPIPYTHVSNPTTHVLTSTLDSTLPAPTLRPCTSPAASRAASHSHTLASRAPSHHNPPHAPPSGFWATASAKSSTYSNKHSRPPSPPKRCSSAHTAASACRARGSPSPSRPSSQASRRVGTPVPLAVREVSSAQDLASMSRPRSPAVGPGWSRAGGDAGAARPRSSSSSSGESAHSSGMGGVESAASAARHGSGRASEEDGVGVDAPLARRRQRRWEKEAVPPTLAGGVALLSGADDDAGAEAGGALLARPRETRMKHLLREAICKKLNGYGVKSQTKIRKAFRAMDTNHDGTLSMDELREGLDAFNFGLTDEQVEWFLKECDIDHSGAVDYLEFMSYFTSGGPERLASSQKPSDNVLTAAPWEIIYGRLGAIEKERAETPLNYQGTPTASAQHFRDIALMKRFLVAVERQGHRLRVLLRRRDPLRRGRVSAGDLHAALNELNNCALTGGAVARLLELAGEDPGEPVAYEELLTKLDPHEQPARSIGTKGVDWDPRKARRRVAKGEAGQEAAPELSLSRVGHSVAVKSLGEKFRGNPQRVMEAFARQDLNDDGCLTHRELKKVLEMLLPGVPPSAVSDLAEAASSCGPSMRAVDYRELMASVEQCCEQNEGRSLDRPSGSSTRSDQSGAAVLQRDRYGASPLPQGPGSASLWACSRAEAQARARERTHALGGWGTLAGVGAGEEACSSPSAPPPGNRRFASTPRGRRTKETVQPDGASPSFLEESDRFVSTQRQSFGDPHALTRGVQGVNPGALKAHGTTVPGMAPSAGDLAADAKQEARLEGLRNQKRRYMERMRLYEVTNSVEVEDWKGKRTRGALFSRHALQAQ